eukprot:240373_1
MSVRASFFNLLLYLCLFIVHAWDHQRPNVTMTVTPSSLITPNGFGNVTLTYSNAYGATINDSIGIYTPATSIDTNPLLTIPVTGNESAVINITLTNIRRKTYQFRYFMSTTLDNGTAITEKCGSSNIVSINPYQPLGGHISITNKGYSQMRVMWTSANLSNSDGSLSARAKVEVGVQTKKYVYQYNASGATYNTSIMCQMQATHNSSDYWGDGPGIIYNALLTNLKPNTTYYYRYGSDIYWSVERSFTTAPINDDDFSYTFLAYGDQGYTDNACMVVDRIVSDDLDSRLVVHIGDISMAKGHMYIWDQWSYLVEAIASHMAYMVVIGNHEYDHSKVSTSPSGLDPSGEPGIGFHPDWGNFDDDSHGECGLPLNVRYIAPSSRDSNGVFWYSFDYGFVHYIMMSSEHNLTATARARVWLENDLKLVNQSNTPFTIFAMHRPMYFSQVAYGNDKVAAHLIADLEDLFFEYGVDIVLQGHVHNYQRTCAVFKAECIEHQQGGIYYMTIGTGGQGLSSSDYIPVEWSQYVDKTHWGYGRFEVSRNRILFEFVNAEDGGTLDSVIINART